jgi:hypothetical protein
MTSRLDHIVVVAQSLAAGSEFVEAALGQQPGPGRKHAHMGTHNLLLALGASVYLEVVAVDPEAAAISRARWFGLEDFRGGPRLAAWVASTDDIFSSMSPELGTVETMQRAGRTWQMTTTADGSVPLGGAAPLLIQRSSGPHPAAVLPESNLRLRELRIQHPAPTQVSALLSRIGLADPPRVAVVASASRALSAVVETPFGLRTLGEA